MAEVFWWMVLTLSGVAALLYSAGNRRLLNFVDYGTGTTARRINRYAAARLLLPVLVNAGCAGIAALHPHLALPLLFLAPLSILAAVVWIAAGMHRFKTVAAS
jgi:hypothetical protein